MKGIEDFACIEVLRRVLFFFGLVGPEMGFCYKVNIPCPPLPA